MQKGLTGKRPVKILDAANHTGVVSLLLFNNSGVNLYLGNDETSATTFNGIPILPNVLIPGMLWEGELWVGADVDNTEFRYQISNAISFNDAKQNRNLNVSVTPQGFLSPKVLSCILLLFSLLGIPKIGKADQHFSATRQRDYFLQQAPWNQLSVGGVSGVKTFTINNLINTGQILIHIENFDTSSHTLNLAGVLCGVDPGVSDYDIATPAQQGNKFLPNLAIYNGLILFAGTITVPAQGQSTILSNYVGCSSLHVRFSSAESVTTLVDVLYYINYQASAFTNSGGQILGATSQQIIEAMSGTIPTPLRSSVTGSLSTVSSSFSSDNWLNSLIGGPVDASGNTTILANAPSLFSGVSWDRQFYCPNTSTFSVASTITQVVALSGTTKIRICSFSINPSTVTAGSTDIVYGTGTNCGTGTTTLTGPYTLPAAAVAPISNSLGNTGALITPTGQAVCIRTVTSTANGFLTWSQY